MPTDDERRAFAARLRGLAGVALRGSDDVVGFIEALDEELFDFGPNLMSDIALRLADLIEPEERTCRIVMASPGEWECSGCGRSIDWDSYDEDDPPNCNYCPNCGRPFERGRYE